MPKGKLVHATPKFAILRSQGHSKKANARQTSMLYSSKVSLVRIEFQNQYLFALQKNCYSFPMGVSQVYDDAVHTLNDVNARQIDPFFPFFKRFDGFLASILTLDISSDDGLFFLLSKFLLSPIRILDTVYYITS